VSLRGGTTKQSVKLLPNYFKLNFRSAKVVKKEKIMTGYWYQISYDISLKSIKHKAINENNKSKKECQVKSSLLSKYMCLKSL
jgi:hypothetical protein